MLSKACWLSHGNLPGIQTQNPNWTFCCCHAQESLIQDELNFVAIFVQCCEIILVWKTRNSGVFYQMGGFNPAGTPNSVYYPLGLVTTPQNTFWTQSAFRIQSCFCSFLPAQLSINLAPCWSGAFHEFWQDVQLHSREALNAFSQMQGQILCTALEALAAALLACCRSGLLTVFRFVCQKSFEIWHIRTC